MRASWAPSRAPGRHQALPGTPPVRALDGVDLGCERRRVLAVTVGRPIGQPTRPMGRRPAQRLSTGTVRIDGHDISRLRDARLAAGRRHQPSCSACVPLRRGPDGAGIVADGCCTRRGPAPAHRPRAREALAAGLAERGWSPSGVVGEERQAWRSPVSSLPTRRSCSATSFTKVLDVGNGEATCGALLDHADGRTIVLITYDREICAAAPPARCACSTVAGPTTSRVAAAHR